MPSIPAACCSTRCASKPAKEVHPDDLINIRMSQSAWTVRVRFISDVRGPAGVAQTLYAETERKHAGT